MSKKPLVFITITAVLLALAVLLNPSPERHRSKIKEVIAERTPIAGALGLGHSRPSRRRTTPGASRHSPP